MSLMGGWSSLVEPLNESSPATLPQTQLLAAQPHDPPAAGQSRARYAAIRVPSTPDLVESVPSSSVPCGMALDSRKLLQPTRPADISVSIAVPTSSLFFVTIFIVMVSLKKSIR